MEAISASSSSSSSAPPPPPCKHVSNSTKKGSRRFVVTNNTIHGSLFYAPPPPPSTSFPFLYPHQHQNPPLLPLPISEPRSSGSVSLSRGLSLPLTSRRYKGKRPTKRSDHQPNRDSITKEAVKMSKLKSPVVSSTLPPGPDPSDLPKNLQKLSGYVFTQSPPPSSLPLPKFSIRPKAFSCTAEAVGVDAGATDNLRRLLHLR
ncbi:hypothetical protein K2173_027871 [Erythroxylum novogranatense]|uniref:Uncharacterized protein n=1 Tax=Erythroxylum novogranatense TaxID=1862640 RepID=A0AAV8U3J0_9ROSI|nr:hypothetical protein K2173_027871 [Erythroxylum novogranatense]